MSFAIVMKEKNSNSKTLFNQFIDSIKKNYTPNIYTYSNDIICIGKYFLGALVEEPLILNSRKTLGVMLDGEIYDIEKVSAEYNIDTDDKNISLTILQLYEKYVYDFIPKLNGSFNIFIYDFKNQKLTIINDRFGMRKLFYSDSEKYFVCSPKIKPIAELSNFQKTLKKDAIIEFFTFGYLLEDKTFFRNVNQLSPASILEVTKESTKLTKYWDYEYDEEYDSRPQGELIDELGTLWQKAVERRVKKDEKVLIPLSGGLDSRAILATVLRCTSKDNIITFTFGEKGSLDFEIGKMVAKRAGVKNIPLGVEKEDFDEQYNISLNDVEGMIDATPYFAIQGYKKMKEYSNYVCSGYIGDFIMGSHMYPEMINDEIKNNNYDEIRNLFLEKESLNFLEVVRKLLNKSFFGNIENPILRKDLESMENKNLSNIFFNWFLHNHVDNYTYFTVFRFNNLFKYTNPFLDRDLIDFMRKIPPEWRYKQRLFRKMLLKKYPVLFKLPTKNNYGYGLDVDDFRIFLRRAIFFSIRKLNKFSNLSVKRNFQDKMRNYVDYDNLLRRDKGYRNYMRRMIEKVEEREYFNKDYIEKIWRLHMQGKKNYSMLLGLLVTFELFLEEFVNE